MGSVNLYFLFYLLLFCTNFFKETRGAFSEGVYTAAPGVEGYYLQIPLNDSRLQDFLNGEKTSTHLRYERDNGLNNEYDIFETANWISRRNARALTGYQTPLIGPRNKGIKFASVRQMREGQTRRLKKEASEVLPLSFLDVYVACQPYSQIINISDLANDNETFFTPYCMDVPICKGCCGHKKCYAATKESKAFIYKTWLYDDDIRVPIQHLRTFTITYDTSCEQSCDLSQKDCKRKHFFDPDQCKCVCTRHSECNWKTHYWDQEQCECLCNPQNTRKCRKDTYFSHGDCGCHGKFFDDN